MPEASFWRVKLHWIALVELHVVDNVLTSTTWSCTGMFVIIYHTSSTVSTFTQFNEQAEKLSLIRIWTNNLQNWWTEVWVNRPGWRNGMNSHDPRKLCNLVKGKLRNVTHSKGHAVCTDKVYMRWIHVNCLSLYVLQYDKLRKVK